MVNGDKSISHRAALLSILARETVRVINFSDGEDCQRSLNVARAFGVSVNYADGFMQCEPPSQRSLPPNTNLDCGNSGTTARLTAGLVAGTGLQATLSGDESLSARPMKRVITPLTEMGADITATDGHLPMHVRGGRLRGLEYQLPIPSAQVKSALLFAGMASGAPVTIYETIVTRDHTELMVQALEGTCDIVDIKVQLTQDPSDPRKRIQSKAKAYSREIILPANGRLKGGTIDIPGDLSTAAYFFALGALAEREVTVRQVGINPTRTGFLDYLKSAGAKVSVENRSTVSGEPRADVTVSGGELKARKVSGQQVVELLDEIPILAVVAALSDGTTIIRDASELRVKETDRLAAIASNLKSMGVKVGLLDDGLAIEGAKELHGADLQSFSDHRIAMAFAIAAQLAVGPSTIDGAECVSISCPRFFEFLATVAR